jgi:hypothetical protein
MWGHTLTDRTLLLVVGFTKEAGIRIGGYGSRDAKASTTNVREQASKERINSFMMEFSLYKVPSNI